MRITKTDIQGLLVIEGLTFHDNRGKLFKPFTTNFFEDQKDVNLNFKETWFTVSKKDVVRAMHLQIGEFACEKLVSVVNGHIKDVILDIREDSETYGKWFEIELTGEDSTALYIPKGCAHGYRVLEDNSITLYMATETNVPKDDLGIKWDSFGYDWEIEDPILSEKDKNLPDF